MPVNARVAGLTGRVFNKEARWAGNFRDLAASVTRMATFSAKDRIEASCPAAEIARLKRLWSGGPADDDRLDRVMPAGRVEALNPFDRVQLAHVVETCRSCRSLSEAGRLLFAGSLAQRASSNDADRLRRISRALRPDVVGTS